MALFSKFWIIEVLEDNILFRKPVQVLILHMAILGKLFVIVREMVYEGQISWKDS